MVNGGVGNIGSRHYVYKTRKLTREKKPVAQRVIGCPPVAGGPMGRGDAMRMSELLLVCCVCLELAVLVKTKPASPPTPCALFFG